jgi:FPC/CPF motif-containing protein YcgG
MKGNPFGSRGAVENSSLYLIERGQLAPFDPSVRPPRGFAAEAHEAFRKFVMDPAFPCVGAKAAVNDEQYGFAAYNELGAADATEGLCRDLCHLVYSGILASSEYSTFVAVFQKPLDLTETDFEARLWLQLRALHVADARYFAWDKNVSRNPLDPHFSFSFAGQAFYIVGMHGNSSRRSRSFPWPALIFNPHEQFERLRTDGKWRRIQKTIRARDVALQGSINPMLRDFGEQSEARQYSGRPVPQDWTPPFPNGQAKCPFGHQDGGTSSVSSDK